MAEEKDDFVQEYMAIRAECFVKKYVRELNESAYHNEEEISTSITYK